MMMQEEREIRFFVAGELILSYPQAEAVTSAMLVEALGSKLDDGFARMEESAISLLDANTKREGQPVDEEARFLQLDGELQSQIVGKFSELMDSKEEIKNAFLADVSEMNLSGSGNNANDSLGQHKRASARSSLVLRLTNKLFTTEPDADNALMFLAAALAASRVESKYILSPNWLLSSSMGSLVSGGPGSYPVAPQDLLQEEDFDIVYTSKDGVSQADEENPLGEGRVPPKSDVVDKLKEAPSKDLDIYVLDTIPSGGRLLAALSQWGDTNPFLQKMLEFQQPLFPPVFDPTFALRYLNLQYYGDITDKAFFDTHSAINGYDYDLSDHGLFVSSIIFAHIMDEWRENDKIHLIQALNDKGIGTSNSLIQGLDYVIDALKQPMPSATALVNCSLTVAFDWKTIFELVKTGSLSTEKILILILAAWLHYLQHLNLLANLEEKFNEIKEMGYPICAAAGNESLINQNIQPNDALPPAAFESVIGVGATDSNKAKAVYSFIADLPETDGFWAFGGDVDAANERKADAERGILGLYTNNIYPNPGGQAHAHNMTGTARWAGTSFATPMATGLLAKLMRRGESKQNSEMKVKADSDKMNGNGAAIVGSKQG